MTEQPPCHRKTSLFFNEDDPDSVAEAKEICAGCPMIDECRKLFYSFEDWDTMSGCWFGTTTEERKEQYES